jgi:integrase-like protein
VRTQERLIPPSERADFPGSDDHCTSDCPLGWRTDAAEALGVHLGGRLARKWLREHVQPNLKPGAAANYKSVFCKHVAPELGAVRLDDCKPQLVKAPLAASARTASARRLAKVRRHMYAMFAFAQDGGWSR